MKKSILTCIVLSLLTFATKAQRYQDALLYGKKENRIKPLIVQHLPEKSLELLTMDSTAQIFINTADSSLWCWYKHKGFFKVGEYKNLYTFTNGLTESGGTVKLGGALTANTEIDVSGHQISFSDVNNFYVESGGATPLADLTEFESSLTNINGSNIGKIKITGDSIIFYQTNGNYKFKNIPSTTSTTGRKVLIHDTATGKVERIDPSLLSGETPTLQQVLTAGSTLTSNHVINGKNNFFKFDSATIFMNKDVEGSYFSSFEMNGNEFILAVGNSEYNFANKIVQNVFETSFSRDITVRDEMADFDELGVSLIDDNITVGERGLYSNGQIIAVYRNDGIYDYYSFAGDLLRISSLTGSADFGLPIFNIAGSNTRGISLKEKSGTYQTGIFEPENDYMIAGYDRGEGSIKYKFANEKFWINEGAAIDSAMLQTNLYIKPIDGSNGVANLWDQADGSFGYVKVSDGQVVFGSYTGETVLEPVTGTNIAQYRRNVASLNFPSTAAQSSSDLTMTVPGADVGNHVILNITSGTTSYYTAWVSAVNTVTVRLNNYGSAAVDPAVQTFSATVFK